MIDIGIDRPGCSTRLLIQQALALYRPEAILPFLEDGDIVVRTAAARELQLRGGELALTAAKHLRESKQAKNREIAAFLLGQLGAPKRPFKKESIPILSELLFDRSSSVREAAAAALGHLKSSAAIAVLVEASNDPSANVRSAVAFALSKFPNNDIAKKCLKLLSNDSAEEVRRWAE